MYLLRYSAFALALLAAPALAQAPMLDLAPMGDAPGIASERPALVDSLFNDSGDNDYQFTIGFGFPGGSATPSDPGEFRASRYAADITYTVPATRTEPFILTGMRTRYRTSSVSASTSTPARVRYDADAPPVVSVFAGLAPAVTEDSLGVPEALYEAELPYTTASIISSTDGAELPVPEWVQVDFAEAGGAVSSDLVFQPGDTFVIRIQFFNVPFPMQIEGGFDAALNGTSLSPLSTSPTIDLVTFNGEGAADTGGADGIDDTWIIRPLSDDALFPVSSEEDANRRIALDTPFPNPAAGAFRVPFSLREGGVARVAVYDVLGREVASAGARSYAAGPHAVELDAASLAPGMYIVALEADGERRTRSLVVGR